MHVSLPSIRRRSGPRNYFGDGHDGDVVIAANTNIPSTTDGDMVVMHYNSLTINAGALLTTANRCRGLIVYVKDDCVINGTLAMTGRGCKANPADASTSSYTPVAPSDGHAVPATGITIRRLAVGFTDTDVSTDHMYGCGVAAVQAEANQLPVEGNGIVVSIPRIGGAGAAGASNANGGTAANAPGGGGAGQNDPNSGQTGGAGAAATCFSGGSGGGGGDENSALQGPASPYGGQGGPSSDGGGSGAGNPAGTSNYSSLCVGEDGTGGLLILLVGGNLSGSGLIASDGKKGGNACSGVDGAGGGSGAGAVLTMYAGTNTFTGTIRANGGASGTPASGAGAGAGGAGAVIGPLKINA